MATVRMHHLRAPIRWGRVGVVVAMVATLLFVAPPAAQAALPDVGFLNATSTPGEGAGTYNITIQLTTSGVPLAQPLVFDVVDTGGGTADPADYSFTSPAPSLQFDIGDNNGATRTVPITINQDSIDEINQTVILELQPVSGGDIDPLRDTHTATITDDDALPTVSINSPPAVTEGTAVGFTVSLTGNATEKTVTVNYATANGTATAGSDYTAGSGTVTFTPGDTSEPISIATTNDSTDEPNGQTFTVTLSSPSNATLGTSVGTGTINDNDSPPTVSINSPGAVTEGSPVNFSVTLSAASEFTVQVGYATANGTASAGSDYTAQSGTVTFTPGDVLEQVSIATINDSTDEANGKTFTVTLSGPSNATLGTSVGTGTINDNDGAPTISINSPAVVEEGNPVVFTVTLSNPSASTVSASYATANGTALAGSDYTAQSGTVTFTPGDTSEPISITTIEDTTNEADGETFTVTLSNPSNGTLGTAVGTGTIDDDDSAPTVSINSPGAVTEGSPINFTVTLSHPSASTVTVNYGTTNGTATAGQDYTAKSGTVTFTPGDTSEPISIVTTDDNIDELNGETFTVTLSSPSGATLGTSVGTGTINDNDSAPTISIADASPIAEGATSSFTVTLSRPSSRTVTVDYATAPDTAVSPGDFDAVTTTQLSFAPGDVSETILISTNDDALDEEDTERFFVNLSNPSATAASIADGQGFGFINDNDELPVLSVDSPSAEEGLTLSFTVSLSAPSARTVTVSRTTANVTAIAGSDYTALPPLVLTFTPGETEKTVVVSSTEDALDEINETFRLVLSSPTNARPATTFGIGQILDDDGAPGITAIDAPAVTEGPGTVQLAFTVSLLPASGQSVSVNYATANGTATAPGDYTGTTGTVTFDPGDTSETVLVTVADDALDEIPETMFLNLSLPVNSTITDAQAVGTINDNDNQLPETSIGVTTTGGTPSVSFDAFETVRLAGSFTDPGMADPHIVTIDWGDGTSPSVINVTPVTARTFEGTHQYAQPGLYEISASVSDEVGNTPKTAFVVINEGSAGHSTGLVDTSQGRWYLYNDAGTLMQSFFYGNPGDYPFMGDWDGDGIETPGLYRQSDGFVYLRNSNTQGVANIRFFFGNPGDVPIAGDFNGDGKDTVSIYRPSNQTFYIINKLGSNDGGLGAAETSYVFGNPGDKPFVGDFDGDGVETVGLHRESTGLVYYRNTHNAGNAHNQFLFGDPNDRLVAGDWTGDGVFSPALYRPSNRTMYFRHNNTQGNADAQWTGGTSSWIPVSGATGF